MSTRTLIEINHDLLHELKRNPEFMARLIEDLGSSCHCAGLNAANGSGKPLHVGCGVSIVLQRHHSTDVDWCQFVARWDTMINGRQRVIWADPLSDADTVHRSPEDWLMHGRAAAKAAFEAEEAGH